MRIRPSGRLSPVVACLLAASSLVTLRAYAQHGPVPVARATDTPPEPKGARPSVRPPLRRGDAAARRNVAASPTVDDVAMGAESAELRALYLAEQELFPPAAPAPGHLWPRDLPAPLSSPYERPIVHASGLPPQSHNPSSPPKGEGGKDLGALAGLKLPDLPVRWDMRVLRYLEFFRDDPRGRATFATFYRRSGRYEEGVKRTLRRKGAPEDLMWLAMVESGFDPVVRSPAGAAGLWQFMAETGKAYGLSVDRWADQRLHVEMATEAAADHLNDLRRRFGNWDLAMAAYNMGYGGVSSLVKRYNTNDYWVLSHTEGSFPWETTLYVPKILAVAIIAKNLSAFGFGDLTKDAPIRVDEVIAPPGTSLAAIAQAAGATLREIEQLNPELRAGRTPPGTDAAHAGYGVKVPHGKGAAATAGLSRTAKAEKPLGRHVVRFGESLGQIADAHRTTVSKLLELNGILPGELIRGGTTLLVPKSDGPLPPKPDKDKGGKPVVVVPAQSFAYADRGRYFYRVLMGDSARAIGNAFGVTVDDLRRWNNLDPGARLIEGMTVQLFVPKSVDLTKVVALGEKDVRILPIGSDEFFAYLETQKGHRRITVPARKGDTLEAIGKRYGVPAKTMERINRKARTSKLREGEVVVVYVQPHSPYQGKYTEPR